MRNFALIFSLLFATSLMAQPPELKQKKEKLDAMRVAFITNELDLTPEEAQVFWPVFNERNKKVDALRHGFMKQLFEMKKAGTSIDDLSEKELEDFMQMRLDNEMEIAKINASYHDKFIKVLGTKKTAKLYISEIEFQHKLMERFRNKKKEGERGPRP